MRVVAGVDEVGRGSLIGPVFAAAVILNRNINRKLLKDSKSLSKAKREILSKYIKKNSVWEIGKATVKEIERLNILNASLLAMTRALKKLKKNRIIIDEKSCSLFYENILKKRFLIVNKVDPIYLMKSIKNKVEIDYMINSHIFDGIALTKFLYWIKNKNKKEMRSLKMLANGNDPLY